MEQVPNLVKREVGGSHDEASSGGVAVDVEAAGDMVELESPSHVVVGHENPLGGELEFVGGERWRIIWVGGEEIDGGDVVVQHLVYVG